MKIEMLVDYIKERISDIKESMNETKDENSFHYGMLSGELDAYSIVLEYLNEMENEE